MNILITQFYEISQSIPLRGTLVPRVQLATAADEEVAKRILDKVIVLQGVQNAPCGKWGIFIVDSADRGNIGGALDLFDREVEQPQRLVWLTPGLGAVDRVKRLQHLVPGLG
ncbi:hypothetical protein Tco_0287172 [Tanacetum coccineum]